MKRNSKGVVLVSGGMDSLVTAAVAKNECDELYFLHVNYGQLTEQRELDSFNKIVEHYKPKDYLVTSIEYLKQIGATSLIDITIKMDEDSTTITNKDIPNTYVPFRNGHLIAIAVSWAEVLKAEAVYVGVVEIDGSGYPDCRRSFINSYNKTIATGTKGDPLITINAPLINLAKKEIVLLGHELKAPFEISWSCYRSNQKACRTCPSCQLRIKAFEEAGVKDPITYR
jgi:7-cyano-7-deazaguanine synthase